MELVLKPQCNVMVIGVLVAQSCPTLCNPMDCSTPGSSMRFTRQEYWSGLPLPSPGDLPNPGISDGVALANPPAGKEKVYFRKSQSWVDKMFRPSRFFHNK